MAIGKALRNLESVDKSLNSNLEESDSDLYYKNRLDLLEYLPEFIIWLNEQINLGNHQFILGEVKKDSVELEDNPPKKIIFLLVELLNQYSDYSGISVFTIHEALKQALSTSYCYTIERGNQIIEITPCLYPLHYNFCYDAINAYI